jgi:hypothetical protein
MPDETSPEETPEERALSALRSRMARPQPKAPGEPIESAEESGVGSGSATGFVGMLAKRQLDGEGSTAGGLEGESERRSRYPLQMAREIPPQGEAPPVPPTAPAAPASWWYRASVPAAWVMAILLLGIGTWAVGALIYMHQHSPQSASPIMVPTDVRYPLLAWRFNAGPLGDFTATSRMMARTMLLCVPVSFLLMAVAVMLRRRMR